MSNKATVECETCNGWGWLNSDVRQTCPDCNGKGRIKKNKGKK